jgi:hypothetical protein
MAEKDKTNVEKIEYTPPDDTNIPHYYYLGYNPTIWKIIVNY